MTEFIGTVSYGVCCAAYLVLSMLLLSAWRGGWRGALLVVASGVTAIWAGLSAWLGATPGVQWLEIVRAAAWGGFFMAMITSSREAGSWMIAVSAARKAFVTAKARSVR